MPFSGARVVTDAALDAIPGTSFDVLDQLTERLRTLLAASRVRRDLSVRRQIEHVWKPTFDEHTQVYSITHKRLKGVQLCTENPYQSYGASPAIWDHTVLPVTRHR